jgi:hypothetical protein
MFAETARAIARARRAVALLTELLDVACAALEAVDDRLAGIEAQAVGHRIEPEPKLPSEPN